MSLFEKETGGSVLWIGITGSIGSGKTTFSNLLRNKGEVVLDADELAKGTLEPNGSAFHKVVGTFGESILDSAGRIDRAQMAQQVFSDKSKLEILESIIHPEVRAAIEKLKLEYKSKNQKYLFYDVPLLFEKKMEKSFDLVVMITTTSENQINRIKFRNKWTEGEIQKRLAAQLSPADKEARAHILIHNDGDRTQLAFEAEKFLEWLKTIS
jgi:dephospho-CoA kinase